MFGYLSGIVISIRPRAVVLNIGGIGYLVHVNKKLLTPATLRKTLALQIHTHQTSDTISLFGFATEHELNFFELLLSVNGVGPKTALDILETPLEVVENLIVSGDAKALAGTPGIGPKTAARIVLELKTKLVGGAITVPETSAENEEVVNALESLGFKHQQIRKVLTKLPSGVTQTEAIVKWFLSAK